MSSVPKLNKEESIILDDNNNSINNINKTNSNNNIIKTEIITTKHEFKNTIGEPAEFNLNLNGEVKVKNPSEQKTAVCWNCESLLIVKNGGDIVECSECHKLNRIPPNNSSTIEPRISVARSYGNLSTDVPYIYGIVICPICEAENKFRKNSSSINCFKCGNIINLNNNNLFNNYNQNNLINRSYDFSSPYVNSLFYPNVIQLRGLMPLPPAYACYGNCAECTLNKILKALKKRPKETYIPYPMYPFYRHEEPKQEIKYVPIKTEPKKEVDEQFKIVIRKKPKNRNAKSLGKYSLSKNKAFEKVFFSKLK